MRRLVQRRPAGDVGCGHRRPADRVVAAALPRRVDADAGGDQVDVGAEVREVGEGVVHVGAAGRGAEPSGVAVEVRKGGDGHDLVVGGGDVVLGVVGLVAGRYGVGHAGSHRAADGLVHAAVVA